MSFKTPGALLAKGPFLIARNPSRFVEAWAFTDNPVDISIGVSNFDAAHMAAEALLAKQSGAVAFAARRLGYAIERHREDGYRTAVSDVAQDPIVYTVEAVRPAFAAGAELMRQVMGDDRVKSVLFAGDVIAVGALFEAQRMGVSVPQDLEICGIGNYEIGAHCVPSLSTVSIPSFEVGKRTVEAFFDETGSSKLSSKLIFRESASL